MKEDHVHNPPQDHIIVMRSGRMRWIVGENVYDAGPGDVIVTPAGVDHSYEVIGDEDAKVICVEAPPNPKPES